MLYCFKPDVILPGLCFKPSCESLLVQFMYVYVCVSLSSDVKLLCHDGGHGNYAVSWYLFTTLAQGMLDFLYSFHSCSFRFLCV